MTRASCSVSGDFDGLSDYNNGGALAENSYESGAHAASEEVRQRALNFRAGVLEVAAFLPLCAGCCAICFAETGQLSKHSYKECLSKKGSCEFRFGAALAFVNDHQTSACPLRKFLDGACVCCWCPLYVDNVGLHAGSPGDACSAFDLKNWALYRLCETHGLQERIFRRQVERFVRDDSERRQVIFEFFKAAKLLVEPDVIRATAVLVETVFDASQPAREVNKSVGDRDALNFQYSNPISPSYNNRGRVGEKARAATEMNSSFSPVFPSLAVSPGRVRFTRADGNAFLPELERKADSFDFALKFTESIFDEERLRIVDQLIQLNQLDLMTIVTYIKQTGNICAHCRRDRHGLAGCAVHVSCKNCFNVSAYDD